MGTNNLTDLSSGVIDPSSINNIHNALEGEFVGRQESGGTKGTPVAGKSLGNATYPWGNIHGNALLIAGRAIDFDNIQSEGFRIVSAKQRSGSAIPAFIIPAGVGNGLSFTVDADPTPLSLLVGGTPSEFDTDTVESGLTAAPGSNNTASVNEPEADDQHNTRLWCSDGLENLPRRIAIDSIGSEISSRDGTWQVFQLNNGSATELFLAYVNGSYLEGIKRGFFFDESGVPIQAVAFADNDSLTLMNRAWVFADADGVTIESVYNLPLYQSSEPSSPSTADYWFDTENETWKRYSGSAWVAVDRMLIGMVVMDDADCIAYRCTEIYQAFSSTNLLNPKQISNTKAAAADLNATVSVNGKTFRGDFTWDITADLASTPDVFTGSLQDRDYFFYVTEAGEVKVSDIPPMFRQELGGAFYHPYQMWRCVYSAYVAASVIGVDREVQNFFALPPRSVSELQLGEGVRPGRLVATNYFTAGSSTYEKLINNPRYIRVRIWGGGGGGGFAINTGAASHAIAGGGGGGAYAERIFLASELDKEETVTVGAAGAAGNGGSGGAGGNSTFNGITAGGGGGGTGAGAASSASFATANGGNGGVVSGTADYASDGQNGAVGIGHSDGAAAGGVSQVGKGGDSPRGGPGGNIATWPVVTATSNAVLAGRFPGGGGAGAANATASTLVQCGGGSGAAGLIIIEEYA